MPGNPNVIYLEPECSGLERCWCQDDQGPCDDCGAPWVKYVRADSAPTISVEEGRLREALDIARKQIVELACVGTEKLRGLGYDADPAELTYLPILDRIDAALKSHTVGIS